MITPSAMIVDRLWVEAIVPSPNIYERASYRGSCKTLSIIASACGRVVTTHMTDNLPASISTKTPTG